MPYKWQREDMLPFLEVYKRAKALWDRSSGEYYDRHKRVKARCDMIRDLHIPGLTVADVKSKIRNIQTSYSRQRQMLMLCSKQKNKNAQKYEPVFWYNTAAEFLKDYTGPRSIKHPHPSRNTKDRKYWAKQALVTTAIKEVTKNNSGEPPVYITIEDDDKHIYLCKKKANTTMKTSTALDETASQNEDINQKTANKPAATNKTVNKSASTNKTISKPAATNKIVKALIDGELREIKMRVLSNNDDQNVILELFGKSVTEQLKKMPFSEAHFLQHKIQHMIDRHKTQIETLNSLPNPCDSSSVDTDINVKEKPHDENMIEEEESFHVNEILPSETEINVKEEPNDENMTEEEETFHVTKILSSDTEINLKEEPNDDNMIEEEESFQVTDIISSHTEINVKEEPSDEYIVIEEEEPFNLTQIYQEENSDSDGEVIIKVVL